MDRSPTAACVVVGNEILSGKIHDTNSHHLARWLRRRGIDLVGIRVIPDDVETIARVVREASSTVDHVFTSGGVGPTHDDMTYAGVASAFGLEVRVDPQLHARMASFYGTRMTDVHVRMAQLPHPCDLLDVDGLWVPVVRVRNVHVLPGVPLLFERMVAALDAHLRGGVPVTLHDLYTLQSEEELAPLLEATLASHPGIEIGSYPRLDRGADHRVRITLESRDPTLCARATVSLRALMDPARLVRHEGPALEG